jgi:hypothetical protein
MADLLLPARKRGQQQEALSLEVSGTEKSNFELYFWPRMTLVTLLKYGTAGYLAWRVYFCGRKNNSYMAEQMTVGEAS